MPETQRDHVIVCGLHDEGMRIVEQLNAAGVGVVVVDAAPAAGYSAVLDKLGVRLLAADARLPQTLADAGAERALALVSVESDDLRTLATALLAHELHPDIRIVVQVRNAAVGRALADLGVRVLDVANLAAPSIADACLTSGHPLRMGDQELLVAESTARRDATLRDLYGDMAPIAVTLDGQTTLSPGRDLAVARGTTVHVLGPQKALSATTLRSAVGARFGGGPTRPSLMRTLLTSVDRKVQAALIALICLACLSVLVLRLGYRDVDGHMTLIDALYFTVETIGTVGFGDFYFRDQEPWLRMWAIFLMIVGALMATVFFALMTNMLVSRRLAESFGRRRITALDDHVVVVGAGSIGVAVVDELLKRKVPVVVVDRDDNNGYLGQLRERRVPFLIADATQAATWEDARLSQALAVAVVTSDDMANLETGLAVRDLLAERRESVPVVLRLFERQLTHTVSTTLGFRNVRSPAALAAPWFVGAALGLHVVDTFYVGSELLLVAELALADESPLLGVAMRDLPKGVRVVSLVHQGTTRVAVPRRDSTFAAGDVAHLIGPYDQLIGLIRSPMPEPGTE